jgi:hypothetical protein
VNEPVVAGYTVTALLTIIVNLLVVFGVWDPSPEQIAAVTTFVVAAASIVAAWVTRSKVTPV